MRKTGLNRNHRIVYKFKPSKKIKDGIYYRSSWIEVLELMSGMVVGPGESMTLESLVDGEWVEQEVKDKNKKSEALRQWIPNTRL